jgi:hypothetical protein
LPLDRYPANGNRIGECSLTDSSLSLPNKLLLFSLSAIKIWKWWLNCHTFSSTDHRFLLWSTIWCPRNTFNDITM